MSSDRSCLLRVKLTGGSEKLQKTYLIVESGDLLSSRSWFGVWLELFSDVLAYFTQICDVVDWLLK